MKKLLLLVLILSTTLCSAKTNKPKYKDASQPIDTRVEDLFNRMTLDEKLAQIQHLYSNQFLENNKFNAKKVGQVMGNIALGAVEAFPLTGRECAETMNAVQRYCVENTRLGIPIFTIAESLHGSAHDGSTIFPQAIALGSTFDPNLAYEMAEAVSKELKAQGVWQSLTPVLDVIRDLRWGRVEECFSEDPFYNAVIGAKQVRGYMDNGISPMLKHFGAHAAPSGGLNIASVTSSERELLSIHLKPFEYVIKNEKPWAVMSSYNSWNQQPNSSSHYLQTEILRDQWGFEGYIYSDWGSISMLEYLHKTAYNTSDCAVQALTSGLDLEASSSCYTELKHLIESGDLDEEYVNIAVKRVLRAKFALGMFENPYHSVKNYDEVVRTAEHKAIAKKIADESLILMKNEDNLLPLDLNKIKSVALIGPNANQVQFGDYTWTRNNDEGVTLLQAMTEKYGNQLTINYAKGCNLVNDDKEGFAEAQKAALESDISIVVVGSSSASLARDYSNATSGEGFDLHDLNLTGVQEELVKMVYETGKPVVFVLLSGRPFSIPWVKENIPAVLVQWYPGEQGGYTLAEALFGEINPSGRLNCSFPQSVGHLPAYYNYLPSDKGYYKVPGSKNKPGKDYVFSTPDALWSFGHGLSYTHFNYLEMSTDKDDYKTNDTINITVDVKNEGPRDGKEVVQVYIKDLMASVVVPIHELKGFKKILIKKGDTERVQIKVPVEELALYNKEMKKVVEPGAFEIQVGRASNDICLKKIITVDKDKEKVLPTRKELNEKPKSSLKTYAITVSGIVRDVQANILKNVTVKAGDKEVKTNSKGYYEIETTSTSTIIVGGDKYQAQEIPVEGKDIINISLSVTN